MQRHITDHLCLRPSDLQPDINMKFLILAICILPVVLSAALYPPKEKRVLLDTILSGLGAFDLTNLKCDIQLMLDVLGQDPTEAACETECHSLLTQGHVLNFGCPLVCHGFQELVHMWHIVPDTTDPSASVCATPATQGA